MRKFGAILFVLCLSAFAEPDKDIPNVYADMATRHEKATAQKREGKGTEISALTFNLGLLTGYLAYVPEYRKRKAVFIESLTKFIEDEKPTFLFFQELWYRDDFQSITTMAERLGYSVVVPNDKFRKDLGLQILVRNDAVKKGTLKTLDPVILTRTKLEAGLGFGRALQLAEVELNSGIKLLLANTHLSAGFGANAKRVEQAKTIGKHLKEHGKDRLVVLGGDFNASPEFKDALKKQEQGWNANRAHYAAFYEETQLLDGWQAMNPEEAGWTWDKDGNPLIAGGPKAIRHEPFQRVDFVMIGKPDRKKDDVDCFRTLSSQLAFTENIPGEGFPLSDHWGVFSKFLVFPK